MVALWGKQENNSKTMTQSSSTGAIRILSNNKVYRQLFDAQVPIVRIESERSAYFSTRFNSVIRIIEYEIINCPNLSTLFLGRMEFHSYEISDHTVFLECHSRRIVKAQGIEQTLTRSLLSNEPEEMTRRRTANSGRLFSESQKRQWLTSMSYSNDSSINPIAIL